jgi:hypothetical protein
MNYGGSWAPVIDGPNDWVSIGSDNSCVLWSDVHEGDAPDWGETGENNEANTRWIVCCNAQAVEEFEEEELAEEKGQVVVSSDVSPAYAGTADKEHNGVTLAQEAGFQMSEATQEEIDRVQQQGEEVEELSYVIAAEKFKPVFFDRESGWGGTTYREAVQFCEVKGHDLHVCPFMALCPQGLGENPIRTFNSEDMMWVPGKIFVVGIVTICFFASDQSLICLIYPSCFASNNSFGRSQCMDQRDKNTTLSTVQRSTRLG